MILTSDDLIRLAMSILVGSLIGAEREYRSKAAGFRTITLITLGSTFFTMISFKLGGEHDAVRIAANIVTGIGFLGAGAIFRDIGRVTGLTTASTIWMAAALGMGIGAGYFLVTIAATAFAFVVLWGFSKFEDWFEKPQNIVTYQLSFAGGVKKLAELEKVVANCGLHIHKRQQAKREGQLVCVWELHGNPETQDKFVDHLYNDKNIKSFSY